MIKPTVGVEHWFAWHPVYTIGGEWAWLRTIGRWTGGWHSQIRGELRYEYCILRRDLP